MRLFLRSVIRINCCVEVLACFHKDQECSHTCSLRIQELNSIFLTLT